MYSLPGLFPFQKSFFGEKFSLSFTHPEHGFFPFFSKLPKTSGLALFSQGGGQHFPQNLFSWKKTGTRRPAHPMGLPPKPPPTLFWNPFFFDFNPLLGGGPWESFWAPSYIFFFFFFTPKLFFNPLGLDFRGFFYPTTFAPPPNPPRGPPPKTGGGEVFYF